MRALVITDSITRRDSRSVERYLNEIGKYDLLSPEEELDLFQRYRQGDERAFARLISANLRFVVSVAKQYQHVGLSLNDLINEGNLGLIKAARRFDETKGFKFISYAVWWIRQTILQAIQDKGRAIRVPQNQQTVSSRILRARDELLQRLERDPSIAELAQATGLTEVEVEAGLQPFGMCRSLDAPIGDGEEEVTLEHFLADYHIPGPDHRMTEEESLRVEMHELLRCLAPREAEVIALFFGLEGQRPLTLNDIAERFDLSRERVRQIKDRALRRLQRYVRNNAFNRELMQA
jgi:RNA polymerase primary sigma factor